MTDRLRSGERTGPCRRTGHCPGTDPCHRTGPCPCTTRRLPTMPPACTCAAGSATSWLNAASSLLNSSPPRSRLRSTGWQAAQDDWASWSSTSASRPSARWPNRSPSCSRWTCLSAADLAISLDVARLLPRAVAERDQVLVLGRTADGLRIATADPTNVVALDDVRAYTGSQTLTIVVATSSMIQEQIARVWSMGEDPISMSSTVDDDIDDITDAAMLVQVADQAPTVKLVNQLLADAVRVGASDIHVEQQADGIWIRHRIDGVLRDVTRMPKSSAPALVSRLKIIAGHGHRTTPRAARRPDEDQRERHCSRRAGKHTAVGQWREGRGPTASGRRPHHASRPARHGARSTRSTRVGSDVIAGSGADHGSDRIRQDQHACTRCSPKSPRATRTSSRSKIRSRFSLPGITQVQINERAGMTFARGLRSMLRQDPDVILVGEVRDSETALLALEASLTGHLVLSTLHTNNACAAVTRLIDMGVEPYLVASSLALVVGQRLVRRPCAACAKPYKPSADLLSRLRLTPARSTRCPSPCAVQAAWSATTPDTAGGWASSRSCQ